MNRRAFLRTAAAAPALPAAVSRPNILWISCEDSGPEVFSCYGDPNAWTPATDAVARRGVRYTHCYSVAGVCAPTRSGIITGMYPASLGSHFMRCQIRKPADVRCFPEYLRDAGYFTTNNVKTDYNFAVPKGAWDENSAKAHWRNRPAGKPFFSVFNWTGTHESQIKKTGREHLEITPRVPAEKRVPHTKVTVPPFWPDTAAVREQIANYYECAMEFDQVVAGLLAELEADGLTGETVVFIWGDHGVGLPRAKRWNYESGTRVPLIVAIPEKFRQPGQGAPGTVDAQLVSFLDLAPTVLRLAGLPGAPQFQGRAFLGAGLDAPRTYIHSCHDRMDERYETIRAVRDIRYRYLRNYRPFLPYYQYMNTSEQSPIMEDLRRLHQEGKLPPDAARWMADAKPVEELYDVEADPWEVRNLASDPALRPVLERMRKEHAAWQDRVGDLGLIPEGEILREEAKFGSRREILRQPGRRQLVPALRAIAGATDPSALRKALAHPEASIRYWAATGLANRSERVDLLADPSPSVRIAAAMACLRAAEDPKAAAVLGEAMSDPEEMVRLEAGNAADRIGDRARLVERELEALVSDKRNRTTYPARVANRVLNRLRGTDRKVK